MRGKRVVRRWGWDCHGLPIENIIEKELDLNSRAEILEYGIDKFNQAAREQVLAFKDTWEQIIPRTGRWVDMEKHYKTMDASYTESCWWAFKQLADQDLVYRGYKPMHLCPRCETTLSNNEVADGYQEVTDLSVTVKFELADEPETYLLAWTTTPWTLPGNTAIAVGPEVVYSKVRVNEGAQEGTYILAQERLEEVMKQAGVTQWEEVAVLGAEALLGRAYRPPYDYFFQDKSLENHAQGWKVYLADFVTAESGTGIAHEAPAFGADDYYLAQQHNIPVVHHLGPNGRFTDKVVGFEGLLVKAKDDHQSTDIAIIKDLAHRGLLFSKEKIVHSYPHCWRCDTPLLNFATTSWFIKTTALRERMLEENNKIHWVPDHLGHKRFHHWIEHNIDWAVSRSRFWGAPLPIWENQTTREYEVVGSLEELRTKTRSRNNFILIRHGESVGNTTGTISLEINDEHDRLSEAGKDQVVRSYEEIRRILAEDLLNESQGIDLVIHSPYNRTKQTAAMIAQEFSVEDVVADERIRERYFGDKLSGTLYADYYALLDQEGTSQDYYYARPGGENYHEVKQRMMDFLEDIDRQHQGKTIVVVTHFTPYWVSFAGAQGMDNEAMHQLRENWGEVHNAKPRFLDYAPFPHNSEYVLDLHRPYIDAVTYTNSAGEEYRVVGEVFDCWYESGSMPYASKHYLGAEVEAEPLPEETPVDPPGETLEEDEAASEEPSPPATEESEVIAPPEEDLSFTYPAHFIGEAIDQTRGWFYSLLALGVGVFDQAPMRNVIVTGHIMAEDGRKMSKKLQNYPELSQVFDAYGADALRYFLLNSPVLRGEKVNLTEQEISEVQKKVILRLKNTLVFFHTYQEGLNPELSPQDSPHPLDRWLLSRLAQVHTQTTEKLESYELDLACQGFLSFVDDLSTWYLRRSRNRFKTSDSEDKAWAQVTTWYVLREFAKILAPFMPFLADHLWRALRGEGDQESVHLELWSPAMESESEVLESMSRVRQVVSLALEARATAGIKVRQPLSSLRIKDEPYDEGRTLSEVINPALSDLIREELNVKELHFQSDLETSVALDTTLTPALQTEGDFREFVRTVQALRKEAGLSPHDQVRLRLVMDAQGQEMINHYFLELEHTAGVGEVDWVETLDAPTQQANALTYQLAMEKL